MQPAALRSMQPAAQHICTPMSSIHEDDSIFDLIADSSDPQQPTVVEECAATLIDSVDFQDTLLDSDHESDSVAMESDHGDFQDTLIASDGFQDTLLDSPSIGGLNGHWFPHAEPRPDHTAYSLCALWGQPMCEEESLSEESSFDSQCTANDNPGLPDRALPVPLAPHFTIDPAFWDSFMHRIESYSDKGWFETSACLDDLRPHWEQNCDVVTDAIQSIVSRSTEFKIGITLDPQWRFWSCAFGEYSKKFHKMTIVYAAPFSKAHRLHSTGMMERDQIGKFKSHSSCLNVAPGGEGASAGSPHFLYVVSN